jgi:hypothetical protein
LAESTGWLPGLVEEAVEQLVKQGRAKEDGGKYFLT